ncbi:MAG: hypothetical protein NWP69_14180, partial [Congregibacter sp.]|nr:hypothetical protein [Congregibacter sp.]
TQELDASRGVHIREQKALLDKIRTDFEAMSIAVNEAEALRRQLRDLMPLLTGDMLTDVQALDETVTAIENQMLQIKHTGKGQDTIRLPGMIMEKLAYLASTVAIADFKPADQYIDVYAKLSAEWAEVKAAWEQVKGGDVVRLREKMIASGVAPLILAES